MIVRQHRVRDEGAVLVLTLILTVVLALVAIALATYASVGLRTSGVTDLRNATNADGAAAVTWAMEEFRLGHLDVTVDCSSATPTPISMSGAGPVIPNGSSVTLECSSAAPLVALPVVTISALATQGGTSRTVEAVAQIAAPPESAVRALDWSVDDVPLAP